MASVSEAVQHQTAGIGYRADEWDMELLERGTRLYRLAPGNGPYFFNYDGLREHGANAATMYAGCQLRPSSRYPRRIVVVEYEVITDFWCPTATCGANATFGEGGAEQYFIDEIDFAANLHQTSPGWGLDGLGIAYF